MTIIEIVQIVTTCLSWLVWAVALILTLKARAGSKTAQKALQPLKSASEIMSKLPGYITQAENLFGSGTGAAKLGWVVQQIFVDCIRNGFSPDIDVEELTTQIENILSTPQKKQEVISNGPSAAA